MPRHTDADRQACVPDRRRRPRVRKAAPRNNLQSAPHRSPRAPGSAGRTPFASGALAAISLDGGLCLRSLSRRQARSGPEEHAGQEGDTASVLSAAQALH